MVATSMNQSEGTVLFKAVNPENAWTDTASEQIAPFPNEGSGGNRQNVSRCRLKLSKNVVIAILSVLLVCSLGYSIFSQVQVKQLEAQIEQMKAAASPKPSLDTSCPQGWTQNAESCYLFSDTESTWESSHINCSSYGASLPVMATLQERDFINENKAPAEYWIGLQREDKGGAWKLADGSYFNISYVIKGEGLCASLNDGVVSSTDCDSHRRWICRKPLRAV